ncbi:MAG TPA: DUF192 domain-containing protein [Candidatus Baltobacteraceae bacterium]|nr:DUF192 domain-containing protein [Candidatus Baltobacteraceae bacterium]
MDQTPVKPAAEPAKKTSPAVLAVCALVVLFAVGIRIKDAIGLRHPVTAEATLRGRTFTIEVADTPAKRELGLGERDALAADAGMYFPFETAQRWVFWMKGMRFAIDIIWIRDGKVVDIAPSAPPPTVLPLETYTPSGPADAVLELNAGMAKEIGLEPGDEVILHAPENKG